MRDSWRFAPICHELGERLQSTTPFWMIDCCSFRYFRRPSPVLLLLGPWEEGLGHRKKSVVVSGEVCQHRYFGLHSSTNIVVNMSVRDFQQIDHTHSTFVVMQLLCFGWRIAKQSHGACVLIFVAGSWSRSRPPVGWGWGLSEACVASDFEKLHGRFDGISSIHMSGRRETTWWSLPPLYFDGKLPANSNSLV